jgi:uncharacterized protein YdeI (YjbR/CyaY-like superfamily)
MNDKPIGNLKRARNPMPAFVRDALVQKGLLDAYCNRPAYQQNDYLGWINRAKRDETKQMRVEQMLTELQLGNVYMKMKWNPRLP